MRAIGGTAGDGGHGGFVSVSPNKLLCGYGLCNRARSTAANLTSDDAFAPQLLAGHSRNEIFEIRARQVFADTLQAARQILAHPIRSPLTALGIEIGRVQEVRPSSWNRFLWNGHLASHGREGVAGAPRQKHGSCYGCAASPNAAWQPSHRQQGCSEAGMD